MEVWKQVKGYEGLYLVSNKGRVKGEDRLAVHDPIKGTMRQCKGKIMKQKETSEGYLEITLSNDNVRKTVRVHRLVAEAFIHNDNEVDNVLINHKDENKSNNVVENLEWCSSIQNNTHGTRVERVRNKRIGGNGKRKVIATDSVTREEKVYPSMTSAEVDGFKCKQIWKCCNGTAKSHKGFYWEYYKEENE
ncbi:HNH endonuclease [Bacillus phage Juglone]|uniref:HNH endonuclease n=1 Tax=Bacillus phage Juglone TaxID=1805949 RepID=A0A143FIR0_9CAUD|nr:HNH endonuclease [Bacillus phage Juglone]